MEHPFDQSGSAGGWWETATALTGCENSSATAKTRVLSALLRCTSQHSTPGAAGRAAESSPARLRALSSDKALKKSQHQHKILLQYLKNSFLDEKMFFWMCRCDIFISIMGTCETVQKYPKNVLKVIFLQKLSQNMCFSFVNSVALKRCVLKLTLPCKGKSGVHAGRIISEMGSSVITYRCILLLSLSM